MRLKHWFGLSVVTFCLIAMAQAAPPEAPKVSTFAPAADLSAQLAEYVTGLEESVASEEAFKDSESKIDKDANTVSVIALSLGLSDEENKYKQAAPALIKASQAVTAAEGFAAVKAAVADLKAAMTSKGDAGTLKWEDKVASMPELMAQVPLINTRLKRYTRGSRLKSKAADTKGYAAVIAAIGQASMANAEDTEKPDEAEKWHTYCAEMRDAAAAVHKAIDEGDEDKVSAAMDTLQKSCDDCHAVFHEEELGTSR